MTFLKLERKLVLLKVPKASAAEPKMSIPWRFSILYLPDSAELATAAKANKMVDKLSVLILTEV